MLTRATGNNKHCRLLSRPEVLAAVVHPAHASATNVRMPRFHQCRLRLPYVLSLPAHSTARYFLRDPQENPGNSSVLGSRRCFVALPHVASNPGIDGSASREQIQPFDQSV